jgi:hypothetical protein
MNLSPYKEERKLELAIRHKDVEITQLNLANYPHGQIPPEEFQIAFKERSDLWQELEKITQGRKRLTTAHAAK